MEAAIKEQSMKISEVVIYKLEATNKELGIEAYNSTIEDTKGPYYRIMGHWYSTSNNKFESTIYPLNKGEAGWNSLFNTLENNFKEMMPFKGQMELF